MLVTETFLSVDALDMPRATAFYAGALGATVKFASPDWASLDIAGVRVALARSPGHEGGRTGLHFAVADLAAARANVERAGGRAGPPVEVAPGVVIALCVDTEANGFTLTSAG